MNKDWIIEVLGDLHGFASTNALPQLAQQLEEAKVVAIAEIVQGGASGSAGIDNEQAGRCAGTGGRGF